MYSVGQLVYQSPAARGVAFVYLLIMHTLVFASLARMTHHTSGRVAEHHGSVLGQRDLTTALHGGGAAVGLL